MWIDSAGVVQKYPADIHGEDGRFFRQKRLIWAPNALPKRRLGVKDKSCFAHLAMESRRGKQFPLLVCRPCRRRRLLLSRVTARLAFLYFGWGKHCLYEPSAQSVKSGDRGAATPKRRSAPFALQWGWMRAQFKPSDRELSLMY